MVRQSIQKELSELDNKEVEVDTGVFLKPSQCYHLTFNPFNLLFNTNCPEYIKKKVEDIFRKYLETNQVIDEYPIDYSSPNLPSCIKELKPHVYCQGNRWVAIPEENMGSDIRGEGDSPGKALEHFVSLYAKEKENSL